MRGSADEFLDLSPSKSLYTTRYIVSGGVYVTIELSTRTGYGVVLVVMVVVAGPCHDLLLGK